MSGEVAMAVYCEFSQVGRGRLLAGEWDFLFLVVITDLDLL